LRGLGELADPIQSALQSFLLAEALDQRVGLGAGQRELEEFGRRHAADPLVSLGLAERYASRGKHELALPLFEQAIAQPQRWYGLRALTAVLTSAIQSAEAGGDEARVAAWTEQAQQWVLSGSSAPPLSSSPPAVSAPPPAEPAAVAEPLFALASVEAEAVDKSSDKAPAEPAHAAAAGAQPPERAALEVKPEPSVAARETAPEPAASAAGEPERNDVTAAAPEADPAAPVARQPEPVARVAPAGKKQPPAKPQVHMQPVSSGALPVVTPRPRMSTDPGLGALRAIVPSATEQAPTLPLAAGRAEVAPLQTATERPPAHAAPPAPSAPSHASALEEEPALTRPSLFAPAEPQPALTNSIPPDSEERLMLALRQGNLAAGEQLLGLWSDSPQRVHDRVNVHRLIVAQRPGDAAALERLLHSVVEGNDVVYQTALRHALLVHFDPTRAPAPPPLAHQAMQPDALLSLLCGSMEPVLEVLSLLWQTASHLLRVAEPPPVGAKRLTTDTLTPLGQLSTTLSRLFGAARVQVYHQLGPRPVQLRLVLEQPMRLMVVGPDLADIPEFRFHFGSMLLAARPEYALLYGLAEADVRELLNAAVAAFGPPGKVRGPATEVVAYAGRLWESVPARVQRRLQELTSEPELIDYSRAFQATNTALWRAGLFAAGDLAVAVLQVCAQEGLDRTRLASPGGLQLLCEANARLAAIVRFGTSVQYAEARWRPLRSTSSAGHRGL
jgi:cellulose synthase operon protein C